MKKKFGIMCLCGLFVLMSSWSFAATVLFSDLGAGGTYNGSTGYTIGYGPYTQGNQFTPSATATLGSIGIALGYVSGPDPATVTLHADSSGLPGATLESWTVSTGSMPVFGSSSNALITLTSVNLPLLTLGTPYWLLASNGALPDWDAWNENSIGATGLRYSNGSAYTDTMAAFQVTASSVPIPGALLLFGPGLVGLAAVRRKFKK
jgi:hypothetical protein